MKKRENIVVRVLNSVIHKKKKKKKQFVVLGLFFWFVMLVAYTVVSGLF